MRQKRDIEDYTASFNTRMENLHKELEEIQDFSSQLRQSSLRIQNSLEDKERL